MKSSVYHRGDIEPADELILIEKAEGIGQPALPRTRGRCEICRLPLFGKELFGVCRLPLFQVCAIARVGAGNLFCVGDFQEAQPELIR